ncbi:hydrogen gas-evolving membrane-bound hydrogenase subunit E [Nocardioides sp. TF02-7]|uniref:hydrogen gas-evolving membrane-bound hydrogenase subunit E n=1 Tax=Nocardioides sp. TF02-7 TaxID=2917724 RepID=UPI001F06C686|nr:hydrogen gas-evolving membrane-bound hydrogenase subunit E [Nocardioides sp. TF02-7]UMG91836.1 DUF4040 domain-containing protein [Nocardioides sp. TF02-7]
MTWLLACQVGLAVGVVLLGRALGTRVFLVAALAPAAAFVWLATQVRTVVHGNPVAESWSWAPALGLEVHLRLDALALVLALAVTGIGALTLLYARWYFDGRREGVGRTAGVLLLFVAAMLLVALADNLLVLYVAWEVTTVCSYLLIADDGRKAESRRAAVRALLVTTSAGFAMLLGFLLLGHQAGTYRISELVDSAPVGGIGSLAVVLVLVGALAKCAQVPFHPWLPEAMVAPTPVSAYLHAAAMVKAGVYLVARLAPGLAESVPWQPLTVVVGLATMVLGGWRALAQTDLKRLLAYGTVAQLGFLVVLVGAGSRTAALAGAVMLVAHALFKSCLFLVVGVIDHAAGSRDLRELSGLARRAPLLLVVAALAAASMVGLPPTVGYLGKEAALEAFHTDAWGGAWVLAGLVLGSALTVAYTCRFLWGAFAGGSDAAADWHAPRPGFVVAPSILALAGLAVGLSPSRIGELVTPYADALPDPGKTYHLAFWHGFTLVVVLSVSTLVLGVALFLGQRLLSPLHGRLAGPVRAVKVQDLAARGVLSGATWLTRRGHARALPTQLALTLTAVVALPLFFLAPVGVARPRWWDSPWEAVVAGLAVAGALGVVVVRASLVAALVLGVVGYLVGVFFVLRGAPDLALVQVLVETLTFVVFVLVLRRMPRSGSGPRQRLWPLRVVIALAVGAVMTWSTLTMSSRHARSEPSPAYLEEAPAHGGPNVVNVIITEYRALDTLGEVTVLVLAATAIASLVLRRTRMGGPPSPSAHADPVPGGPSHE